MKKGLLLLFVLASISGVAQDDGDQQSRESMAVDATAAQWSYQFAYEGFFNYKDDLVDGVPRAPGQKGFIQYRMVAPIPKGALPFTILPRLTLRAVNNAEGKWGFGSSDLFALIIANQWSTGRWGIGPQINFPSQEGFGPTKFGYGLAAAVTQRAFDDKLFIALLFQQAWTDGQAGSLVINPIIVYQLGKGVYIGNGDFVIRYNWQNGGWFFPMGLRLGKAFINDKRTINTYVEWAASAAYPGWEAPVATHSLRFNIQWQIPIKF